MQGGVGAGLEARRTPEGFSKVVAVGDRSGLSRQLSRAVSRGQWGPGWGEQKLPASPEIIFSFLQHFLMTFLDYEPLI